MQPIGMGPCLHIYGFTGSGNGKITRKIIPVRMVIEQRLEPGLSPIIFFGLGVHLHIKIQLVIRPPILGGTAQ